MDSPVHHKDPCRSAVAIENKCTPWPGRLARCLSVEDIKNNKQLKPYMLGRFKSFYLRVICKQWHSHLSVVSE